ncbi:Hint domain-containing protein [Asaia sp. BMEF1]
MGGFVCLLAGTLIRTPDGERLIEELEVGDAIYAMDPNGEDQNRRTIAWIGRGLGHAVEELPIDLAGWPIRICRDALGQCVPSRDLLVTGEHCLFIEDKLIPARMLVNGSSIYYDRSIPTYWYYHIELSNHEIIWGNDCPLESYLDTGNSRCFILGNHSKESSPRPKRWNDHSCAALTTEQCVVEPLFRKYSSRAEQLGFREKIEKPLILEDIRLFLQTATGQHIYPARTTGSVYVFLLDETTDNVRIMSGLFRPCETIGPFIDDRRALGVLVGQIYFYAGSEMREIKDHLKEAEIDGWHDDIEGSGRWTMGEGVLELEHSVEGGGVLAIEILAGGPYLYSKVSSLQHQELH